MRLIEYIVRNNRPFTEVATADYTMVSPYTARGYGDVRRGEGQASRTRTTRSSSSRCGSRR